MSNRRTLIVIIAGMHQILPLANAAQFVATESTGLGNLHGGFPLPDIQFPGVPIATGVVTVTVAVKADFTSGTGGVQLGVGGGPPQGFDVPSGWGDLFANSGNYCGSVVSDVLTLSAVDWNIYRAAGVFGRVDFRLTSSNTMNDCVANQLSEFASIVVSYEYDACQNCPSGQSCCPGASTCRDCCTNSDCPSGEVCVSGACQVANCGNQGNGSPCNDNLYCNGTDTCLAGTCSQHSGEPCPVGYVCDESSDSCVPGCIDGSECSDDLFCSSGGICRVGKCFGYGSTCPSAPGVNDPLCNETLDTCDTTDLACAGETRATGFLTGFGELCPKSFTFAGVPHVISPVLVRTYAQGQYATFGGGYHVDLQGVGRVATDLNRNHTQNCLSGTSINWYFEISPEDWNQAVDFDGGNGIGNARFDFTSDNTGCGDCGSGVNVRVVLDVTFLDEALDCNLNGLRDDCDIIAATSADCNANGVPDECDAGRPWPEPAAADTTVPGRNRFLSMTVPAYYVEEEGEPVATPTALQVTLIDLQNPNPPNAECCPPPDFSAFEVGSCSATGETEGCARWVGALLTVWESQDNHGLSSYPAARLQCTPYYTDWTAVGTVHVVGAEIIPSSTYDVRVYAQSCMGDESTCTAVSCPLTMTTARWGDVESPYSPPSEVAQPDGTDVIATLNRFKNIANAPSKSRTLVQPNLPGLLMDVGGLDIGAVVDAFKGLAYPFSGPCVCPSTVTCGATSCTSAAHCSNGMCVKTCVGATDGPFCIQDDHCEDTNICSVGNIGATCEIYTDCEVQGVCVENHCIEGNLNLPS